ncbi:MAG: glycosyltransferase family 4 protein [Planctomycetota bacterium]
MNQAHDDNSMRTLIIGPPENSVGGMTTVMQQNLALAENDAGAMAAPFAFTMSPGPGEGAVARVLRHAGHLKKLRDTIKKNGIQLAHIHTCSGMSFYRSAFDMMVARRLGCRTVLHVHGARFDRFLDRLGPVAARFVRGCLERTDCVIALSRHWKRIILAFAPAARVQVVENAAPRVETRGKTSSGTEGSTGIHFVLLARMDTWKGIDDLLEASVALDRGGLNFNITLAGPGGTAGDATTLGAKITERRLSHRVRYAGPIHGAEKWALLRSADVYVQPSHHEGMPIAVLEAIAMRLPVVGTRVGAMPEIIDDGTTGILVPPHHPEKLAEAMIRMAKDEAFRQRASQRAASLAASRFSLRRFHHDLLLIYRSLLGCEMIMASRTGTVPIATARE